MKTNKTDYLEKRMQTLSDEALLQVVSKDACEYTEEAVCAAKAELNLRNINFHMIENKDLDAQEVVTNMDSLLPDSFNEVNIGKGLLNKESLIARRIGAFLTDHIIITITAIIPFMMNFNKLSEDVYYFFNMFSIAMIISVVGYLCKDILLGRSLGKRLFGIYVREYQNVERVPKLHQLIFRNLLNFIWFVELIVMLFDKEGRRLGDKIAKTQVVGYQSKIVLRIVMVGVIAFVMFVTSLVIGTTQIIKNDASYKTAIQYIEQQDEITTAIGEIQGFGIPMGSLNYTNGYGTANLDIKVKGTKKNIVVRIYLEKSPGSEWIVKDIKY